MPDSETNEFAQLERLAALVRERNRNELEIVRITGRPAQIGHLGEFIASRIFRIQLAATAVQRGFDGIFEDGPLRGRTVNIKWYAKREGLLDVDLSGASDNYLVLAGPKTPAMSSRGLARPWLIEEVFLFNAQDLHSALRARSVKLGIATSVSAAFWRAAEIYPNQGSQSLVPSAAQRRALRLFG
jgi:hypothetical protein